MKKKIFLAVIAIFVICLTCGMLFVACNDKEDDDNGGKKPGDITIETTAGDVLAAVVNEFDAVAKGTSKEYNVALEIVANNVPVFTLAFEQNEDKDYIYAAVGNEFVKINGFDVGGVVVEVLNWLVGQDGKIAGMVPIDAAGFNTSVGALLAEMNILSSSCEADDDAYRVGLNMSSIAGLLSGLDVDGKIAQAGLSGLVDPIVGALFDLLKIDLGADVKPSVGALIDYIGENVDVNAYFGFNDDAADASTEPFGKFDISKKIAAARELPAINALNISTQLEFEALDVTAAGDSTVETVAHKYVLDIDIDLDPFVLVREYDDYEFGILSMMGKEGYLMEDGFRLFIDDKKFSMDAIMDMVADAGYLHISLDDVALEASEGIAAGDTLKNLFTLHFNSEEGKAIVAAALVDAIDGKNYAIGGSYNVSALADIINEIIAQAKKDKKDNAGENAGGAAAETAEHDHVDANKDCKCDVEGCGAAMHVDTTPADGVCDRCKAVSNAMTFIGTLFGELTKKDQNYYAIDKENGTITVYTDNIADYLVNLLMKDPTGQGALVKGIIPQILGGNALRLSVSEKFAYAPEGGIERVEEEDIMYNLREDFAGDTMDEFMASITNVTKEGGTALAVGDIVTVTGKGFGTEPADITATGIVMQITDDTYYIGIVTDMYQNLEALKAMVNTIIPNAWTPDFELEANWPFYGVLAYTVPAEA